MSTNGRVVTLQAGFLTVYWSAGLVNQPVAFDDAIGLFGLSPGHIDRRGGELTEVDVARSTWRLGQDRKKRNDDRWTPSQNRAISCSNTIHITSLHERKSKPQKCVCTYSIILKNFPLQHKIFRNWAGTLDCNGFYMNMKTTVQYINTIKEIVQIAKHNNWFVSSILKSVLLVWNS